jgi:hypothetical protein
MADHRRHPVSDSRESALTDPEATMHTPAPPARKLAALVAGVALAVTACGSGGAPAEQT